MRRGIKQFYGCQDGINGEFDGCHQWVSYATDWTYTKDPVRAMDTERRDEILFYATAPEGNYNTFCDNLSSEIFIKSILD